MSATCRIINGYCLQSPRRIRSLCHPDKTRDQNVLTLSPRANGTLCSDADFLPFGQEVDFTSACGNPGTDGTFSDIVSR